MQDAEHKRIILEPRIIKTDELYRRFLSEVERLATDDPDPDSADGTRLELLAKLVEDYEKAQFAFEKPDPVDAILFRMEQQGLRQKDIADHLGGKNRASEILARKRPLTLPMIRSIYKHLDIPASLLIREPEARYLADDAENGNKTKVGLWLARVREIADSRAYLHGRYKRDSLNEETISYLVRLSWMERGPQLAREFLEEKGVALVIEPHLKGSKLDGAALLSRNGVPIIGLTVRHDRLDHFWFTLIHECIHAWKHLDASGLRAITDEDVEKPDAEPVEIEKEANNLAKELLLPHGTWRRSEAFLNPSARAIQDLAVKLQISPAIVAGRLRYERKNYALFTRLIGNGQVRHVFPEISWE
jgi:HTH-type transcriptional regulator/antitoxin HigA